MKSVSLYQHMPIYLAENIPMGIASLFKNQQSDFTLQEGERQVDMRCRKMHQTELYLSGGICGQRSTLQAYLTKHL